MWLDIFHSFLTFEDKTISQLREQKQLPDRKQ